MTGADEERGRFEVSGGDKFRRTDSREAAFMLAQSLGLDRCKVFDHKEQTLVHGKDNGR